MQNPITPKLHGIMDYAFAATLLLAPPLLGLNKKASRLYKLLALDVVAYSALTDYPAGIKRLISYDTHHKIDGANIAGLVAGTMFKDIKKGKAELAFHIGITTIAIGIVLLTDWDADPYLRPGESLI